MTQQICATCHNHARFNSPWCGPCERDDADRRELDELLTAVEGDEPGALKRAVAHLLYRLR